MLEHNRIGIEESEYFVALLSEEYLNDPEAIECFIYAKNLGKPFIVLRDTNYTSIPEDMFKGINVILNEECDFNSNNISEYISNKLMSVLKVKASEIEVKGGR